MKPVSEFYKNKLTKDGLYHRCKLCHAEAVKNWQQKDGGVRHAENCRRWREENPGRERENLRAWRKRNYSRYRENERDWRARNGASVYARNVKRTKAQKRATPAWADKSEIALVYSQAKLLSQMSGFDWHVDHIVPLNHPDVSGLHVPGNLQLMLATENMRKRNTFEEALHG